VTDDERERLVATSIAARGVGDPDVLRAMRTVPRERFVPDGERSLAYKDCPLPIGFGQTISQPYVVAWMAELGRVRPGSRVLDVGTGSGYQAAVLAEIGADVWSIERVPELLASARAALDATGYHRVHLREGDGRDGWPEAAPFDAILVAAATLFAPPALMDQIGPRGRLVLPLGPPEQQELVVLERRPWGALRRSSHGAVAFVPLV
jgi:protein-L-isoaspartate(D-aspartate) O-methyltransferase